MAAPALAPLEIASGLVFDGRRPRGRLLPDAVPDPRAAFEAAIVPALERAPCLVSFSGGRDSSAVLAVAAHVARREGLPLPVPATNRFPNARGAAESDWQEQVVRHLRLDDWVRLEVTSELDAVGPIATRTLERHGLLWPCNAHFHVPIFEAARGGAVLTGIGGDEALSPSTWSRVRDVAALRVRPSPRDALRLGMAAAPPTLRRLVLRRRLPALWPWLRPHARSQVRDSLAREAAGQPVRWHRAYDWLAGARYLDVGLASLGLLAADTDIELHHPLFDRAFLSALAALPPARRFVTRTDAMRRLFGDVLPDPLLSRATKAHFDETFFTEHSRALAASWSGEGVDHDLVDADALRALWRSDEPDSRSFTLLQAVWLAREGGLDSRPVAPDGADAVLSASLHRHGEDNEAR